MTDEFIAPSEKTLAKSIASVTTGLRPVKPFPSDRTLVLAGFLVFVLWSLAAGLSVGLQGCYQLRADQRWIYFATVLGCGLVLAVALAGQMVPGARRRIGIIPAIAVSFAAMILCAAFIFPRADLTNFVVLGVPCLRAGLLSAAGSGAIAVVLLRRGFFASPLQAHVIAAVFAGFTGVAMLALHCPQQNWAHIAVWHMGAPAISGVVAALIWQLRSSLRRGITR